MCCFSRPVERVYSTQIFARRGIEGGRQALIYSMGVALADDLAMVLPLPVVPGSGDDAVAFVDLTPYPMLFNDLARAFVIDDELGFASAAPSRGAPKSQPTLVVHEVGAFVASYVPSPADFSRLDARFRMPDAVLGARPEYADWGFAVFQLKARRRGWFRKRTIPQTIQPMALTFPSRQPDAVFFPTLHVHDGNQVPATAGFDHSLYWQVDPPRPPRPAPPAPNAADLLERLVYRRGNSRRDPATNADLSDDITEYVSLAQSGGLVVDAPTRRRTLTGALPNADTWIFAPHRTARTLASEHVTVDLRCGCTWTSLAEATAGVHRRACERFDELATALERAMAAVEAHPCATFDSSTSTFDPPTILTVIASMPRERLVNPGPLRAPDPNDALVDLLRDHGAPWFLLPPNPDAKAIGQGPDGVWELEQDQFGPGWIPRHRVDAGTPGPFELRLRLELDPALPSRVRIAMSHAPNLKTVETIHALFVDAIRPIIGDAGPVGARPVVGQVD